MAASSKSQSSIYKVTLLIGLSAMFVGLADVISQDRTQLHHACQALNRATKGSTNLSWNTTANYRKPFDNYEDFFPFYMSVWVNLEHTSIIRQSLLINHAHTHSQHRS